jgi:hypothetical protein
LDKTDSLGVGAAVQRLYFSKRINAISSLRPNDPFRRTWVDLNGQVAVRSEAWGRTPTHEEQEEISALRLVCSSMFLKNVLLKRRLDLLVLIILSRYEKGYADRNSEFWHTTAVVRISRTLDCEFYAGVVNKLHVTEY